MTETDGAGYSLGDVLQLQPDQVTQLLPTHHRRTHRHGARADPIFLIHRQIGELTHAGQRVRQPRHRRAGQTATIGNLEVAEPGVMPLETAQDIERPRHHLDDVALARQIAGEDSAFAEPLGSSSHGAFPSDFVLRNYIPLAANATSGNLWRQQQAVAFNSVV